MQGIQFIGTQRSGSNLLRLMLNQLPTISAPHPPHILQTFIPYLDNYGDLSRPDVFDVLVEDILAWVTANPVEWTNWKVAPKEVLPLLRDQSIESLFEAIYKLKAQSDGASIWCCKSLANVRFVDRLESKGIHPLYLHLVRDGRDVACSFQRAIVGPKHIYHLAKKWSAEQQLAYEVNLKYPDRFILVKYEDLIEDPTREIRRICEAAGVDYTDEVLEYYKSKESEVTAKSGEMWKNVISPIIADNRYKYPQFLAPADITLFNQVAGKELAHYGYDIQMTGEQIELNESILMEFDRENHMLIDQMKKSANPLDLALRRPQALLLEKIEARKCKIEL